MPKIMNVKRTLSPMLAVWALSPWRQIWLVEERILFLVVRNLKKFKKKEERRKKKVQVETIRRIVLRKKLRRQRQLWLIDQSKTGKKSTTRSKQLADCMLLVQSAMNLVVLIISCEAELAVKVILAQLSFLFLWKMISCVFL